MCISQGSPGKLCECECMYSHTYTDTYIRMCEHIYERELAQMKLGGGTSKLHISGQPAGDALCVSVLSQNSFSLGNLSLLQVLSWLAEAQSPLQVTCCTDCQYSCIYTYLQSSSHLVCPNTRAAWPHQFANETKHWDGIKTIVYQEWFLSPVILVPEARSSFDVWMAGRQCW